MAVLPFPVPPDEVPEEAVRYVKRRLLRAAGRSPLDDDVARWIVAGVIAILADPAADAVDAETAAALLAEFAAESDAVVVIQAR